MNTKLILFTVTVTFLCSCSTAYKTTQTPDDVYYSPARFYGEEEEQENKKDDNTDLTRTYSEERQIRLGINDPRWRYFDNDISYSPYLYGYDYGYYYNPYYCSLPVYNSVIFTPVNPKVTTPRTTNLAAYTSSYNNSNTPAGTKMNYVNNPARSYNNSNKSGSRAGSALSKIFNNSNNDYNSSSESSRTYTPSSSASSGSSSSSSGSSSRPARSGRN